MSQRSKCVLPNQLVVFYCFALFCSLAKANWKKEAFQKANPACKISLNHPVEKNAHDMKDHLPTQGQVKGLSTTSGDFTWIPNMIQMDGGTGRRRKHHHFPYLSFWGVEIPRAICILRSPLTFFDVFMGFFRNEALVMPKRNPGFFFCDAIFSSGELCSY